MSQTVTLVRLGGSPTFASLNVNGPTNLSGSFNTSGSLNVSGSVFVSGSLVVSGSIIAQSLVVNTTTYSSGSNVFGNSPSNTQVFTGSMYVGGLISGSVFYGSGANLIGTATSLNIGGNAATVTTNANLTGVVTSVGNATSIANGAITNAMLANTAVANLSGTNTGDQTNISGNSATTSQRTFGNVRTDGINRGSYGAISIAGSNGAYSGIDFADPSVTLMVRNSDGLSGMYKNNNAWIWYFDGSGVLTVGTVPGSSVSGTVASATNATTAGGYAVETGRNNNASKIVTTDANGYIQCGYINSSNGNENNNSNADRVWGTNGSDNYLRTYRTSALSVSYAATAGSATSATTATSATSATSAGSATYATYLNSGQSSTDVTNISSRINSGFFQDSATESHTGWPSGASSWYHLISSTHSNPSNYYALQFAAPFFAQGVYTRNTNNSGTQAWYLMLTTGNYTSYVVPSSGGTFGGNVTINGSSNTPLSMNATEPYMEIVANGASNTAGIAIKPTTGYDAAIGNYRGGSLNLMANSNRIAQVTDTSGVIFYVNSHGPVTAYGSNSCSYYILVNSSASNKTWDITGYGNDFYINESNVATRVSVSAGGGLHADFYSNFSDIRYKNIIETNPTIDLSSIDVIKYTRQNDDTNRITYGYSAQQVQTILPSAVIENSKDDTLSVNYSDIQVLKILSLERKVADLQSQIEALKAK